MFPTRIMAGCHRVPWLLCMCGWGSGAMEVERALQYAFPHLPGQQKLATRASPLGNGMRGEGYWGGAARCTSIP